MRTPDRRPRSEAPAARTALGSVADPSAMSGDAFGHRCSRRRLRTALRSDRGSAVVEFPLVAALLMLIAVLVIQAAVTLHTRNLLIDAAVQGAHHAASVGASPDDGAARAHDLIEARFGSGFHASTSATVDGNVITVDVTATLPLVGLIGPAGGLSVQGRALDEESWE